VVDVANVDQLGQALTDTLRTLRTLRAPTPGG